MMAGHGPRKEGRARKVVLVPHTHWDREWYEPEARFRQRLVVVLDGVVDALQADDRLRFLLDGQTILLHDYLGVRPEREREVRSLVVTGRLSAGPWYVLADENLSGGEALIRNLLLGRADGDRFGSWESVGYCPDAFGHPEVLPQILTGFGIRHGVLWRGYGGRPGQEHDLFRWRGPDASTVVIHHLPRAGYELAADLPTNRAALAARWSRVRRVLEPRAGTRPLLVLNGADHHALQDGLADVVNALNQDAALDVRVGSLSDYFAALPARMSLPEVRGELRESPAYAWVLYGVASTRARLKQAIAEAERLLVRWMEPQAALAWIHGAVDRRPLLWTAWREHLANTFHDTLCGTTVDAVADEAAARASRVALQARGVLLDAVYDRLGQSRERLRRDLGGARPALTLINPSAHIRSGVAEITLTGPGTPITVGRPASGPTVTPPPANEIPGVRHADGSPVFVQPLYRYPAHQRLDASDAYPVQEAVEAWRVAVWVDDLPALGLSRLDVDRHTASRPQRTDDAVMVDGRGRALSGPGYRVSVGRKGGFDVTAREAHRTLRGVAALSCELDVGDTYTFQAVKTKRTEKIRWSPAEAGWGGPLIATLARGFSSASCRGSVHLRLDAGSSLVRVVVEGEHHAPGRRVRLLFPVAGASSRAIADMHFGPVVRDTTPHEPAPYPQEQRALTAPMHRYVVVPGAMTLFARGLYEYELIPDGALAVTLFRSVDQLSRGDLSARPGHAAWPSATPGAAELGPFRAELAFTTFAPEADAPASEWAPWLV